jgi:long-chain acyl-CoA synthetase
MAYVIKSEEELRIKYRDNHNMMGAFDDLYAGFGSRTAIRYMRGNEVVDVTGYELRDAVRKTASELIRMGFYRKHIAIIGKNSYEWLVICMASMYSGCVAVPINRAATPEELKELCEYADVVAVFYDEEQEEVMVSFKVLTGTKAYEMKGFIGGQYTEDRVTEDGTINNQTTRKDTIYILFTSGTTGKSKGVVLPNDSFIVSLKSALYRVESWLLVIPLHHIAGISVAITFMGDGAALHIGEDPKHMVRYLDRMKPAAVFTVPALLSLLCARLKRVGNDQTKLGWNLDLVGCGAAAFPSGLLRQLEDAGIMVIQYYGTSELAGGVISGVMKEDHSTTIGDILVRYTGVKVEDNELLFNGRRLLTGYYKDEESTAEALADGWYHTGDLGYVDEDGYWYLTGRKKNLIILSNGENISPEEIEKAFSLCPEVEEIVVYGEGNFLHAEIYPAYNAYVSEEKEAIKQRILDFADNYNKNAHTYKRVPFIEFRDTPFTKNASGKIMRGQNA